MEWEDIIKTLDEKDFEGKDEFITSASGYVDQISAGAEARITELEAENQALAAELQKTQAQNYQLIMAQTAEAEAEEEAEEDLTEAADIDKLIKED